MNCPYMVRVRSLVALQEQQLSKGQDLPSLNSPENMSFGKCEMLCAIDVTSDTYGNPSVIVKFPEALHVPVCVRVYWFLSISIVGYDGLLFSGGFINSIRIQFYRIHLISYFYLFDCYCYFHFNSNHFDWIILSQLSLVKNQKKANSIQLKKYRALL